MAERSALRATAQAERAPPARARASPRPARETGPAQENAAPNHGNQALLRNLRAHGAQTKLTVNEPGDAYEQEADRVAEEVMRMPEPAPAAPMAPLPPPPPVAQRSSASASAAEEKRLQRKCTDCAAKDEDTEEIQRKCAACDEEQDLQRKCASCEDETAQAKAEPGRAPEAGPEVESAIASLRGGGHPLSAPVRDYFEPRLGYDLKDVRVHTGGRAAETAKSVNALAFTLGNDIVFGAGQYQPHAESGRRLLAHELTHVLQQRPIAQRKPLPRAAAPEVESETPTGRLQLAREPLARAPHRVQRADLFYWEPYDKNGAKNHKRVLDSFGAASKIFTEAPIPHASAAGATIGNRGAADIYVASTTIGIEFPESGAPSRLQPIPGHALRYNGLPYNHADLAAPRAQAQGKVDRLDQAPQTIGLADLKPGPRSIPSLTGTDQLADYREGIKKTSEHLADYQSKNPAHVSPSGHSWKPVVTTHSSTAVPAEYTKSGMGTQTPEPLVLKYGILTKNNKVGAPVVWAPKGVKIMGRLRVRNLNNGIYAYAWEPDKPHVSYQRDQTGKDFDVYIGSKLITPLIKKPHLARKVAETRKRPAHAASPLAEGRSPVDRHTLQRKPQNAIPQARDPFDDGALATWKKNQETLTQRFNDPTKTKEFKKNSKDAKGIVEANKLVRETLGPDSTVASPEAEKAAKAFDRAEFWTGRSGAWAGPMRKKFGGLFLRVVGGFEDLRTKFRKRLKPQATPKVGGDALKAAAAAAVRIIKVIASYLVSATLHELADAALRGFGQKMETLLGSENFQELQLKIAEIQAVEQTIESDVMEAITGLQTKYGEKLDTINAAAENATDLAWLAGLVRWGARIIACVSPPAWGCLWILAQGLLEAILTAVVQSCWFMAKVAKPITKLAPLQSIPSTLAADIGHVIDAKLPRSMKGIFVPPADQERSVPIADLECDNTVTSADEARHRAMENLVLAVGEERLAAFAEAAKMHGVPRDRELSINDIDAIRHAILKSEVTADDLRRYASGGPGATPPGRTVGIAKFLAQVKQSKGKSVTLPDSWTQTPAKPEDEKQSPPAPVPAPTAAGTPSAPTPPQQATPMKEEESPTPAPGEPSDTRTGPIQIVADAQDEELKGATASSVTVDVAGGVSMRDFKGATVYIMIHVRYSPKIIFTMKGLECKVTRRNFVPDVENAEYVDIYLTLQKHATIHPREQVGDVEGLPDAVGFPPGVEFVRRIHVKLTPMQEAR